METIHISYKKNHYDKKKTSQSYLDLKSAQLNARLY